MSDLGKAALARRLYLHVLNGGKVTPDDMSRLVARIEELEAQLAKARNDALEEAAKACDDEVDRVEDAIRWGGSKPYIKRCEAAAYAMRDRADSIRALKSTNQT